MSSPFITHHKHAVICECWGTLAAAINNGTSFKFRAEAYDEAREHKKRFIVFVDKTSDNVFAFAPTNKVMVKGIGKRGTGFDFTDSITVPVGFLRIGLPPQLSNMDLFVGRMKPTARNQILHLLTVRGAMSDRKIAQIMGRPLDSITPIRARLLKAGLIEDSGYREASQAGKKTAKLWRVKHETVLVDG